ncbi:MAG: hypothetical protein EOP56_15975 [Sphingobacteriales bacterium]|nr:MAG: hypothetical protein EOP56_15975 [Sphingobacteriales bacterium]
MKLFQFRLFFIIIMACICWGCANVVPPSGGEKDTTPPKLLAIAPKDSLLNTRVTRIDMRFDEFVTVSDASKEIQISPLLPLPIAVTTVGKKVTVKIPDTLLVENTTYRMTFGNAIKDLHEGNPFTGFSYIFSTGSYFDSLQLKGFVYHAITGLPDSGSQVVLYPATKNDSAIVREKPMYVTSVAKGGAFSFQGLPARAFRIYAMKDNNGNLVYDGGEEMVAFIDSVVMPVDSLTQPIVLNMFKEVVDTARLDSVLVDSTGKLMDTVVKRADGAAATPSEAGGTSLSRKLRKDKDRDKDDAFTYNVAVDTSDARKRTFDITKPLTIVFSRDVDTFNDQRMNLSYDSAGISVESNLGVARDTTTRSILRLTAPWKENTAYTLRLLKGFAKDTAGTDLMPSRYTFRTKSDADYSKLNVHLPSKYGDSSFVLLITTATDKVHNKPVTDTLVRLNMLQPGTYYMRIIADKNKNGKWDTGDLLEKLQPEEVIPYMLPIQLKAGWDNIIDFEKEEKKKPAFAPKPATRKSRDKPPVKK